MSQRLAGFPRGLLSLLGSQSFGMAPKELRDDVSTTVDATSLYLLDFQTRALQVVAAPANGQNAGGGIIVPQGECWRVHAGGIFVLTGVGVTLDWTPTLRTEGLNVPLADTLSQAASLTRFQSIKCGPFWARAGEELGIYISALVGAPTVSITYSVSKLRA